MIAKIKNKAKDWLLWSQKYVQADTVYIASNSFWISYGFVINSILSFVLLYFFANFLPKDTYGTYRYVLSVSGALGFLTLSGMNTAVTQAVSRGYDGILKYSVKIQLKWNLMFLGASYLIGGYYLLHDNYILGSSLLILGSTYPFTTAFNTYGHFLAGKKEFKRSSLWGICITTVYTVLMITGVMLSKAVLILVSTYALTYLLTSFYFYRRTLKLFATNLENKEEERGVLKYGASLSLVNVLPIVADYIDKILIFHFLGAIELAVYGLALSLPERIRGYIKSLNSMTLPRLGGKTTQSIRPIFYKRVVQAMIVGGIVSLGYILVSPLVFKFLLPNYLESVRYSQMISLYFIPAMPMFYMASVFHSQKMIKNIYFFSTGFNILKITLFITLGAIWGIWGMVYALLFSYYAGLGYYIVLWNLELKKNPELS